MAQCSRLLPTAYSQVALATRLPPPPRGLHSPHSTPPLFLNPAPLPLGKFLLCCPHHSGNDSDSLETGPQGNYASKKLPGQFLGPARVGNNSVNTDISLPGFLPSKPHPGLFYSPHTEAPSRNTEWHGPRGGKVVRQLQKERGEGTGSVLEFLALVWHLQEKSF